MCFSRKYKTEDLSVVFLYSLDKDGKKFVFSEYRITSRKKLKNVRFGKSSYDNSIECLDGSTYAAYQCFNETLCALYSKPLLSLMSINKKKITLTDVLEAQRLLNEEKSDDNPTIKSDDVDIKDLF